MPRTRRRTLVTAAGLIGLLVLAPLWLIYAYGLAIESDHSRFLTTGSIAEAKARGVFVAHLPVTDSSVPWGSRPWRVREAWIEERTQVRYTMALPWTRRVERLGTYRLMLSLAAADGDSIRSDERFAMNSAMCVILPNDSIVGVGPAPGSDAFTADIGDAAPARITLSTSRSACGRG